MKKKMEGKYIVKRITINEEREVGTSGIEEKSKKKRKERKLAKIE